MTIEEAIEHCKEKESCTECGQEHRQLRLWLEELVEFRRQQVESEKLLKESLEEF